MQDEGGVGADQCQIGRLWNGPLGVFDHELYVPGDERPVVRVVTERAGGGQHP